MKAKCSDMPRYWAEPFRDATGRWRIFDRDQADAHVATLNMTMDCTWHTVEADVNRRLAWVQAVRVACGLGE
jgi:hypothetical protein